MPWSRTGNQGGSNIVQAAGKLVNNQFGTLNPDDIQVLADAAVQISGVDIPPVTDDQAAAVVSFIDANQITSLESLEQVVHRAEQDIDSVVIPDDVREVLEAIAGNIEQYQELENIDVEDFETLAGQ
jgi:hypothetical protein